MTSIFSQGSTVKVARVNCRWSLNRRPPENTLCVPTTRRYYSLSPFCARFTGHLMELCIFSRSIVNVLDFFSVLPFFFPAESIHRLYGRHFTTFPDERERKREKILIRKFLRWNWWLTSVTVYITKFLASIYYYILCAFVLYKNHKCRWSLRKRLLVEEIISR